METGKMYITIFIIVVVLLIGYIEVNKYRKSKNVYIDQNITITRPYGIESLCIDGIKYYIVHGLHEVSLAPAFNQDGTLKICGRREHVPIH